MWSKGSTTPIERNINVARSRISAFEPDISTLRVTGGLERCSENVRGLRCNPSATIHNNRSQTTSRPLRITTELRL